MFDPDKLHTDEPMAPSGALLYVVQAVGLTALLGLMAIPLAELLVVR